MFRRFLLGQAGIREHPSNTPMLTGQLSNSTKIGRFAKLIRAEIVEKHHQMSLVVFGDNLIGKSVKALCIAREGFDDTSINQTSDDIAVPSIVPRLVDSPAKQRQDVVSMEFLISARSEAVPDSTRITPTEISVSSNTDYEVLARKLHSMYMNQAVDSFTLRCMGYSSAATIVKALGLFNQRVGSHHLHSTIRTESVPDAYMRGSRRPPDRSLRAIVFEVVVLENTSD